MSENKNVVGETKHSSRGASGAPRWMSCPGSISLTEKVRDSLSGDDLKFFDKPGMEASRGSAAHHVAARCLSEELDAWEFSGQDILSDDIWFTVDDDMVAGVQVYVDLVRSKLEQHAEAGARLYVESSMQSVVDDDVYGTGDAVIFVPDDRIIVVDLKYGAGVVVEPTSAQLKYYGYLACENFDLKDGGIVELFISQPRIPHPKGRNRLFVTNKKELEDWFSKDLLPAIADTRATDDGLFFVSGDHCRTSFCPVKDHCPALKRDTLQFDVSMDAIHLSNEDLGTLRIKGKAIAKYMSDLETLILKRSVKGEKVPGTKVVRSRSNRVLKDGGDVAAEKKWGTEAYGEPKMLTPPNLEKLEGGKKFIAKWAYSPEGALTLADESDKRDAVKLTGEEFFGDIDN